MGLIGPIALAAISISAQPPKPQFRDVAGRSEFGYVSRNDYRVRKYFIQPLCGGVAILDYDRDGKPDIFFTNGAELPAMSRRSGTFDNCLIRNRGDGTFEDRTASAGLLGRDLSYSFGAVTGDFDNDGYPDLFLCNVKGNKLYRNNGRGAFVDVTATSGLDNKPENLISIAAAWFDYDHDGLLDLVVANYTEWSPETDIQCGARYCSPTRYVSVPNSLYHNLGNGRFEDVTRKAGFADAKGKGMGISIADFNRDGFDDVLIVNDTERNFLFLNRGDGTFKESGFLYGVAFNEDGIAVNGMGSDAKDFNNDGYPEVFYNNLATQVFGLFFNDGGRGFRYVSPSTGLSQLSYRFGGWSAGFIDYDNDGWKDIYSANGDVDYLGGNARQSDTLFRNVGGKSLRDVSSSMGPDFVRKGFHRGAAFADLNNDGSLDIVVTALQERPRILMNSGTAGNHWLMLDLAGTAANRDAIGAQVKLTTASGRTLFNHVSISTGLMSSSDKRVHFGLGPEIKVRSIEISWPGGGTQVLKDIAADQILRVEQERKVQ